MSEAIIVILMSMVLVGLLRPEELDIMLWRKVVLIKLIEVKRSMRGGSASLSEIYLNPSHIISVTDDQIANEGMINEVKNLGLIEGVNFSKVVILEGSHTRALTIVGTPVEVYGKIKKKQILRG